MVDTNELLGAFEYYKAGKIKELVFEAMLSEFLNPITKTIVHIIDDKSTSTSLSTVVSVLPEKRKFYTLHYFLDREIIFGDILTYEDILNVLTCLNNKSQAFIQKYDTIVNGLESNPTLTSVYKQFLELYLLEIQSYPDEVIKKIADHNLIKYEKLKNAIDTIDDNTNIDAFIEGCTNDNIIPRQFTEEAKNMIGYLNSKNDEMEYNTVATSFAPYQGLIDPSLQIELPWDFDKFTTQ